MSTRLSLISPKKPKLYLLYQILNSYVNSPFITELFNGKMFLRMKYLSRNNISSAIKPLKNKRRLICYSNQVIDRGITK